VGELFRGGGGARPLFVRLGFGMGDVTLLFWSEARGG